MRGRRIIPTIFLALGLAMLWLGFFYHYQLSLKEEPQAIQPTFIEEAFAEPEEVFEIYTLENTAFEEDSMQTVSLDKIQEADLLIPFGEEKFFREVEMIRHKENEHPAPATENNR